MKLQEDFSLPLEEHEYNELDGFLLSLEHDEAVRNLSEFDGFVTVIKQLDQLQDCLTRHDDLGTLMTVFE